MEQLLRATLGSTQFLNVPEVRSRTMAAIRGKGNKSTELVLRMALVRARISGWEMHTCAVKGKPDFYFAAEQVAVFVDGCFWHGCPQCGTTPRTRTEYWTAKFARNRARDRSVSASLRRSGVRVIRIWEHQIESANGQARVLGKIGNALTGMASSGEPPAKTVAVRPNRGQQPPDRRRG